MKYPRTPHLPQSPGGTRDDRRIPDLSSFKGHPVVFTEKMDGSNVCLEAGACFARSHEQAPTHPSFDMFKAFHARVRSKIPDNHQLFGEWCYAKHSIEYTRLPGYFLLFGVRDTRSMTWGSWIEVELWADELCVPTVPRLAEYLPGEDLESAVAWYAKDKTSKAGDEREGFVMRWAEAFSDDDFERAVAKWVRADHVQTPYHWKTMAMVRNRLLMERVV